MSDKYRIERPERKPVRSQPSRERDYDHEEDSREYDRRDQYYDRRRDSNDLQNLQGSVAELKPQKGIVITPVQLILGILFLCIITFLAVDRFWPSDPGTGAGNLPGQRSQLETEAEELCFNAYLGYFRSFEAATAGAPNQLQTGAIADGPALQKYLLDQTGATKSQWLIPMYQAGDRAMGIVEGGTFDANKAIDFMKGQAAATKRLNEILSNAKLKD